MEIQELRQWVNSTEWSISFGVKAEEVHKTMSELKKNGYRPFLRTGPGVEFEIVVMGMVR